MQVLTLSNSLSQPLASSRGRGVRLLADPAAFSPERGCLVQQYVADPATVGGHKFDMRIYALMTSVEPLRVYVYEEGLVRFAAEPYGTDRRSLR